MFVLVTVCYILLITACLDKIMFDILSVTWFGAARPSILPKSH